MRAADKSLNGKGNQNNEWCLYAKDCVPTNYVYVRTKNKAD